MRLPLPKRRFYRFVIYIFAIVLVLVAIDMVLVQVRRTIHPGFDTTRITEPLAPDGTIDYLAAIEAQYSRGVTDDNNAFPILLQAYGRQALPGTQPLDGITDRLHMPHLPKEGDYIARLSDFKEVPITTDGRDEVDVKQWPPKFDPRVLKWVKRSEKPLRKVREATMRSRYFVPINGGNRPEPIIEVMLPHLNMEREAARALAAHALLCAEANDFDSARADVLAIHRLARLSAQGPTLVEVLVSIGIEGMACDVDINIAQHAKLDSKTAKSYLLDLLSLKEMPPFTQSLDVAERSLGLEFAEHCAKIGPVAAGRLYTSVFGMLPSESTLPPAPLFRFLPIPYEQSMRAQNSVLDALILAAMKPRYADRTAAIRDVENWYDLQSQGPTSLISPYWLIRLVLPAINRAQDQHETSIATLRLTQITWALAAYRADHGGYPASLDLLKSQYLQAIPEDNFIDAPFHYQRQGDGYHLYSVGPNMADDKGATTKPADDIDASTN
jgi:hypothetical protein